MRKDFTDITMVIDRSGSMASCKSDAEGGVNTFITNQAKEPGEAVLTLVQFDTEVEIPHKAVNIKHVPPYSLTPRGTTALFDAVGKAIVETGERLKAMPEADRPGLVVFVIVTDGEENSSKEYRLDRIKAMIQEQQDKWKWNFQFLGANQDAFAAGGAMAIRTSGIANYANPKAAFEGASAATGRMRGAVSAGLVPDNSYTEDEKKAMTESK